MSKLWLILVLACTSFELIRANISYFKPVAGVVGGGNFTYYSTSAEGLITLVLHSRKGDADLYISQFESNPTYEPDHYCLHSATCGLDVVLVPSEFKRPIVVGVYGHPSHESSEYLLEWNVSTDADEFEHFVPFRDDEIIEEYNLNANKKSPDPKSEGESEEDSNPNKIVSIMTTTMLEYENQMLLDTINNDTLLIAAKGLSTDTVVLNLIKVHCHPGNLVLVLGATGEEEQFFLSELEKSGVTPLPKVVSSDVTNNEREALYLGGGVVFISSRILVVDLLKGRVPVLHITGFIILRAHKILDSYQEAFSLRLFRQKNHTGFINAFSSSPQTFSMGLMKLERIMKTLFVNNLLLWPRFHATVTSSLKVREPIVVELHVDLTEKMTVIQTALLDIVHFCIKELKRINPTLDTDNITVENALSKSFQKLLQMRLDPIWNQLSSKTKQLVADLKTLRSILVSLTQSDCVRMHHLLSQLRTKEYLMKSGGWMVLDAAETLFVAARSRVLDAKQSLNPEPNPKWKALTEILNEMRCEETKEDEKLIILVLAESQGTVRQLKQCLTMGGDEMLKYWYFRLFGSSSLGKEKAVEEDIDDELDNIDSITLTQKRIEDGDTTFTECSDELDNLREPLIVIQQFKKDGDSLSLYKCLRKFKPSAIVMYDADVAVVRQIEVFQCSEMEKQMKVFFLIYASSVEEQAYLTSLRREKSAFEDLIKQKSILSFEDMRSGENLREVIAGTVNTRQGGVSEETVHPKVIVDMREFRCELPSLLHKRGIDVEPVTLLVGDYILSPEMCVERKSISDLIGSLNSGRLYTQALAMTRHYTKPILLIEFDENKPFALQGRFYVSSDISSTGIMAKLQLLTLHFPRLRLVWSPSPFATAQLFHELKEGKEEPSAESAAAVGADDAMLEDEKLMDKYNIGIQDFVRKLPGVNSKNINALLNKGKSLDHLITLSQSEIEGLLGNSLNSELLYNALHNKVKTSDGGDPQFRGRGKSRRGGAKRGR